MKPNSQLQLRWSLLLMWSVSPSTNICCVSCVGHVWVIQGEIKCEDVLHLCDSSLAQFMCFRGNREFDAAPTEDVINNIDPRRLPAQQFIARMRDDFFQGPVSSFTLWKKTSLVLCLAMLGSMFDYLTDKNLSFPWSCSILWRQSINLLSS